MDRQQLHDDVVAFAKSLYEDNTDPDYDISPMLHTVTGDSSEVFVIQSDGTTSPMDMMATIVAERKPDVMCFISPIWRKDAETRERVGEGLMILSETRKERHGTIYVVERDPLPTIVGDGNIDADDYTPRMKLLYDPGVLQ